MKPIDQTIFIGDSRPGNCFQACVASLLELPLDDVPHFIETEAPGVDWYVGFTEWLAARQMFAVEVRLDVPAVLGLQPGVHCIISGPSPRHSGLHSVVGRVADDPREAGFILEHDPHPSRDFFAGKAPSWVMFIGERIQANA